MFTKNDTLKVKGIAICLLLFHHLFMSENRIDTYLDISDAIILVCVHSDIDAVICFVCKSDTSI